LIWEVVFHPAVVGEDLPALDRPIRSTILKAIATKLGSAPEDFGEPLRRELFGYRKLRVGDYRVIYKIERRVVRVLILKIGMRKDSQVYSEMIARLKRL
jgi:mRNA interferase RelE/StbE